MNRPAAANPDPPEPGAPIMPTVEADLPLLRRGDADAFARLVRAHEQVVLGLGQSIGLRGADLEDAAAETFAGVYRALPRFEGRSALTTWVYRIALRTMQRWRQNVRKSAARNTDEDRPDERQPGPAQAAQDNDIAQRVWEAVAALEPRQAMAVELYYRRDWPVERIATAMECPAGTVKTLLFRARERLRAALEPLEG